MFLGFVLGCLLAAKRVEEINRSLPDGVIVAPYYDQTDLVAGTLRTVSTNLVEGGLLVIAVLFLVLGNMRAAFIVALAIPVSMLFALTSSMSRVPASMTPRFLV